MLRLLLQGRSEKNEDVYATTIPTMNMYNYRLKKNSNHFRDNSFDKTKKKKLFCASIFCFLVL